MNRALHLLRQMNMVWSVAILAPWAVVSLLALSSGTPDAFLRAGALGVALAVVSFGLLDMGFLRLGRSVDTLKDDLQATQMRSAALQAEQRLLQTLARDLPAGSCEARLAELDAELTALALADRRIQGEVDTALSGVADLVLRRFRIEIVALAVATLQWGYGDRFHCWYHGQGWGSC